MSATVRSPHDLTTALAADAEQAMDARTFLATHPLTAADSPTRRTPLIAASVVFALAVATLSVLLSKHHTPSGTEPASATSALAGTSWLLTEITGARGSVNLIADHPASIDFATDGAFIEFQASGAALVSDGLNVIDATYRTTAGSLTLRGGYETGAGAEPDLPAWRRIVKIAMDALTDDTPVQVQRHETRLVLVGSGGTLTFIEGPPANDAPLAQAYAGTPAPLSGLYRVAGGAPSLTGRLPCGSGDCVQGTIEVYRGASATGRSIAATRSDEHGRYSIELPPGVYYLRGRQIGAEVPCHSFEPVIVRANGGNADVVCIAK